MACQVAGGRLQYFNGYNKLSLLLIPLYNLLKKLYEFKKHVILYIQARFAIALRRLISPDGILYSNDLSRYGLEKLKTM